MKLKPLDLSFEKMSQERMAKNCVLYYDYRAKKAEKTYNEAQKQGLNKIETDQLYKEWQRLLAHRDNHDAEKQWRGDCAKLARIFIAAAAGSRLEVKQPPQPEEKKVSPVVATAYQEIHDVHKLRNYFKIITEWKEPPTDLTPAEETYTDSVFEQFTGLIEMLKSSTTVNKELLSWREYPPAYYKLIEMYSNSDHSLWELENVTTLLRFARGPGDLECLTQALDKDALIYICINAYKINWKLEVLGQLDMNPELDHAVFAFKVDGQYWFGDVNAEDINILDVNTPEEKELFRNQVWDFIQYLNPLKPRNAKEAKYHGFRLGFQILNPAKKGENRNLPSNLKKVKEVFSNYRLDLNKFFWNAGVPQSKIPFYVSNEAYFVGDLETIWWMALQAKPEDGKAIFLRLGSKARIVLAWRIETNEQITEKDKSIIQYLQLKLEDIYAPYDLEGNNLIHLAARYDQAWILNWLHEKTRRGFIITQKCDLSSVVNYNEQTVLHIAAHYESAKVLDWLDKTKQIEPLLNKQDKLGRTPLMCVLQTHGNWESRINMLKRLLKLGADPAIRNKKGETAIHIAVSHGNILWLSLLVKGPKGVEVLNAPVVKGGPPTPLALAERAVKTAQEANEPKERIAEKLEVVQLLKSVMAKSIEQKEASLRPHMG